MGETRMGETKDGRAERLKAALRDNLRRRKAQERGRGEAGDPPADAKGASDPGSDARPGGPDSNKTGL